MKNQSTNNAPNTLLTTWAGNFKSIEDQGVLEGDAIVFGSESAPDRSEYKDFFTSDTYVHPEESFITPLYMEHGFSYKKPIGKALMSKEADGWKAIAQLDMSNEVVKSRFSEIKAGGWGFSTGAVGHVVLREKKANDTHFITQWSVGELSITQTPAEEKALIHSVKSLEDYYNLDMKNEKDMNNVSGDTVDTANAVDSTDNQGLGDNSIPSDDNDTDLTNEDLLFVIIQMLIAELAEDDDDDDDDDEDDNNDENLNMSREDMEDMSHPSYENDESYPYLMSLSQKNKKIVPIVKLLLKKKKMKKGMKKTNSKQTLVKQSLPSKDINTKLTVLKSENEELKSSYEILQSSFNEKEALLTEKLVLLSETQEQLELKSQEFIALEEELTKAKESNESLTKSLNLAREANRLLTKSTFNK